MRQGGIKPASISSFWLRDKSLEVLANLPDPDLLANKIVEDIEIALEQFAAIQEVLE
jgi:type I restriction enzyme M protein